MTTEEKAKEKVSWNDVKEKYLKFHRMDKFTENMAIDIDFGYWLANEVIKEALRWRDPKEELPEGGILVQIKFDCSKYKGHPYSHDVFLSGLNRWNIEHHADIKVTGWRPIE